MRLMIYTVSGLFAVIALGACAEENTTATDGPNIESNMPKSSEPATPDHAPSPSSDALEIVGTVRHKNLEGGFFAIDADDGSKYDPVNLPESFKKDGLRVKVTARLQKDLMSFHMYGAIIEVVEIEAQ